MLVVVMSVTLLLSLITIGIRQLLSPPSNLLPNARIRHLLSDHYDTMSFIIVFVEFIYPRFCSLLRFIEFIYNRRLLLLSLHKHRGTTLVANY